MTNLEEIFNVFKKVSKDDHKILSDACEALIGAIYIDRCLRS